jgi:hypothetical protein
MTPRDGDEARDGGWREHAGMADARTEVVAAFVVAATEALR